MGCRIIVLLAYGVCPVVGEIGPETCAIIPLIGDSTGGVTRAYSTFIRASSVLCSCHCPVRGGVSSLVVGNRDPQICFLAVFLICDAS